jgi:hypothetical protein
VTDLLRLLGRLVAGVLDIGDNSTATARTGERVYQAAGQILVNAPREQLPITGEPRTDAQMQHHLDDVTRPCWACGDPAGFHAPHRPCWNTAGTALPKAPWDRTNPLSEGSTT